MKLKELYEKKQEAAESRDRVLKRLADNEKAIKSAEDEFSLNATKGDEAACKKCLSKLADLQSENTALKKMSESNDGSGSLYFSDKEVMTGCREDLEDMQKQFDVLADKLKAKKLEVVKVLMDVYKVAADASNLVGEYRHFLKDQASMPYFISREYIRLENINRQVVLADILTDKEKKIVTDAGRVLEREVY